MAAIQQIRERTFKLSSVQSAFAKTGLYPFNPEVVLAKVRTEPAPQSTPSPPPQPIEAIEPVPQYPTPQTVRSLERSAARIRGGFQRGHLLKPLLQSFVKGALIQAHTGAQAQASLFETQAAQNARIQRSRMNRRRPIQKGGALLVSRARSMVKHRQEDIARKARAAAERAERAAARERRDDMKQQRYQQWGLIYSELKIKVKAKDRWIASQVKQLRAYNTNNTLLRPLIAERSQQHLQNETISTWLDIAVYTTTATSGLGKGPEGPIFCVQQPQIDPLLIEDEGQWYRVNNEWQWTPRELLY
jgi:hypothetical protein